MMERHGFRSYLGILPGWAWLKEHEHDLDGWQPSFEIARPGHRTTVTLRDQSQLNKVVKSILK